MLWCFWCDLLVFGSIGDDEEDGGGRDVGEDEEDKGDVKDVGMGEEDLNGWGGEDDLNKLTGSVREEEEVLEVV